MEDISNGEEHLVAGEGIPRDLRVPQPGASLQLVVPACARAWRLEVAGARRATFASHWTERRVAPGLPAGSAIELVLEPARGEHFGGFLPDIGAEPRGFWQGVGWREVRGLAFAGRPSARWRAGVLRLRGELIDDRGVPVDARREDVELRVEGASARALGEDLWEVTRAAPPEWRPGAAAFEELGLELRQAGELCEQRGLRAARVELSADGERLLWNGQPFRVQGLLHWGYYPELAGPDPDPVALRSELRAMRARGFNLLKACLWVPPQRFLDVCDEEGMAVWIEYPLWNRALLARGDDAREGGVSRAEALARYLEFVRHDAAHPCVALRTLT